MKFLIPQSDMKIRLIESQDVNVQNDSRSSRYLRIVNPSKARETEWVPAGILRKSRAGKIVEIPTSIPANTRLQIKLINKDFAVLEIVSSPILTGSDTRPQYRVVMSIQELLKLKFCQE